MGDPTLLLGQCCTTWTCLHWAVVLKVRTPIAPADVVVQPLSV